nr:unnamed protein product [Callosobruchus chinensis]
MLNSPQQDYEKYLHYIFEEQVRMQLRKLEQQIKAKRGERQDYQAYDDRRILAKYHRKGLKQDLDSERNASGDGVIIKKLEQKIEN